MLDDLVNRHLYERRHFRPMLLPYLFQQIHDVGPGDFICRDSSDARAYQLFDMVDALLPGIFRHAGEVLFQIVRSQFREGLATSAVYLPESLLTRHIGTRHDFGSCLSRGNLCSGNGVLGVATDGEFPLFATDAVTQHPGGCS